MTREEHIIYVKNLRVALKMTNSFSAKTMESLDAAIKALEQEPKTDTWSIKDVADTFKKHGLIVVQEPKTGHWEEIPYSHHYYNDPEIETADLRCSCCKEIIEWDIDLPHKPYYCENCGAKMVELQESEKVNRKSTKCENCRNHNYCDYESQESEDKV